MFSERHYCLERGMEVAYGAIGRVIGKQYQVLTDLTGVTSEKISRADVAHFIVEELAANRYSGQTPLLTY